MKRKKNIIQCSILILWLFTFIEVNAQTYYYGGVSLYDLYKIGGGNSLDWNVGRLTNNDSEIEIKIYTDYIIKDSKFPNILIYHIRGVYNNSTFKYDLQTIIYNDPARDLGIMAQNYPSPWNANDIKSSALAVKNYYIKNNWQEYNSDKIFIDLLGSSIPVKIELGLKNAQLDYCSLPGIGRFYYDGKVSEVFRFDPMYPAKVSDYPSMVYKEWVALKNLPKDPNTIDLKYAAHRGFWGYNLGSGPVENSSPAINAALQFTNIIESDITLTGDGIPVVSHDYNLLRLTDYSGPNPDNTYIFQLNFSQLQNLYLRRRNFEVSEYKFMSLTDLINLMKQYKTVLTVDIKEKIRRSNPITGECMEFCDIDANKRAILWAEILEKVIDVTEKENAWEYIAIKTPFTFNRLKELLPSDKYRALNKLLFFPVIQPNMNSNNALNFICDWYNNAPNQLIGFETNFKTDESACLQQVTAENVKYQNFLQFVTERTHLRPGMYPEEPGGPKGTADRWAQWHLKDPVSDYRGDHYWLMSIPYFKSSILTNDRPDIWQELVKLYH